jgi:hypothetical protein
MRHSKRSYSKTYCIEHFTKRGYSKNKVQRQDYKAKQVFEKRSTHTTTPTS